MIEVIVYSKKPCPYCEQAKSLLTKKGYEYKELDVLRPDVLDQLRELVPEVKTVPQIFIDGKHIGGYTDLVAYFN